MSSSSEQVTSAMSPPIFLKVKKAFCQRVEDELTMNIGDIIEVINDDSEYNDSWYFGKNLNSNEIGLFPCSFTEQVDINSQEVQQLIDTNAHNQTINKIEKALEDLQPENDFNNKNNSINNDQQKSSVPGFQNKHVLQWTPSDVEDYFVSKGFADEAPLFKVHKIPGPVLVNLGSSDLKELDIHEFGTRYSIYQLIQHINKEYNITPDHSHLHHKQDHEDLLNIHGSNFNASAQDDNSRGKSYYPPVPPALSETQNSSNSLPQMPSSADYTYTMDNPYLNPSTDNIVVSADMDEDQLSQNKSDRQDTEDKHITSADVNTSGNNVTADNTLCENNTPHVPPGTAGLGNNHSSMSSAAAAVIAAATSGGFSAPTNMRQSVNSAISNQHSQTSALSQDIVKQMQSNSNSGSNNSSSAKLPYSSGAPSGANNNRVSIIRTSNGIVSQSNPVSPTTNGSAGAPSAGLGLTSPTLRESGGDAFRQFSPIRKAPLPPPTNNSATPSASNPHHTPDMITTPILGNNYGNNSATTPGGGLVSPSLSIHSNRGSRFGNNSMLSSQQQPIDEDMAKLSFQEESVQPPQQPQQQEDDGGYRSPTLNNYRYFSDSSPRSGHFNEAPINVNASGQQRSVSNNETMSSPLMQQQQQQQQQAQDQSLMMDEAVNSSMASFKINQIRNAASSAKLSKKTKKQTSAFQEGINHTTPDQLAKSAQFSGWMLKKSSSAVGTWKLRFFTLHGTRLLYFSSMKDIKEKGLIDITGHRVVPAREDDKLVALYAATTGQGRFCFKLVPPAPGARKGLTFTQPKVHYFAVETKEEMRNWMSALMKATIDVDDTVPTVSTCSTPTVSLMKAQELLLKARQNAKIREDQMRQQGFIQPGFGNGGPAPQAVSPPPQIMSSPGVISSGYSSPIMTSPTIDMQQQQFLSPQHQQQGFIDEYGNAGGNPINTVMMPSTSPHIGGSEYGMYGGEQNNNMDNYARY